MFSCQLDKEKLTELSIVDPFNFDIEVKKMKRQDVKDDPKLLDKLVSLLVDQFTLIVLPSSSMNLSCSKDNLIQINIILKYRLII